MNMTKKLLLISCCVLLAVNLAGCEKQAQQKKTTETVVTAKMISPTTSLYFNGVLKPLSTVDVVSTVDGRIAKLHFHYGQKVMEGQKLAAVNSSNLDDAFRKAVQAYLQAKDAYETSIEKFRGDTALYKAGVNSKITFLSDQSTYENNVLKFYQARFELEKVLKKAKINPKAIEDLSLADTKKVNQLLNRKFSNVVVRSPATGIALFPTQNASSSSSGDEGGELLIGKQIKEGQLLLSIGDLSGLQIEIQVGEININRVKKGMEASISSEAFPGIVLNGKVISVAAQAKPAASGGQGASSNFNVEVEVPYISAQERQVIRVGMTAKIQISFKEKPRVMIPLKAIQFKNGASVVTVVKKNGQRQQVPVKTGSTTPTDISITSGLKAGDRVVVDD